MSTLRRLWARLRGSVGRDARERELDAELESHLQLDIDDRVRRGVPPDEARRQALLALGGVEQTKERVRDQSRLRLVEDVLADARYAVRTFAKDRLFFAVVVLTFAVGIGANTAIFGAVNAVLLAPLPYPHDQELVALRATDKRAGGGNMPVTAADFADWKAATRSYQAIAGSSDSILTLTGEGEPESLIGYRFEPEMWRVLGVAPALGRTFAPADGAHVVVLSDELWRRRFHGDAGIVGRTIRLDQTPYLVVGVMPPSFGHPPNSELWTPLVVEPALAQNRARPFIRVVARLRPGASVDGARAELAAVADSLATAHPETNRLRGASVERLRDQYTGDARPALLVLLGAVGLVLLLTSSNIAGLSLARAARRGREIAVRTALGARRGRIVQQLLTESLILAVFGGVAGLVLAVWATQLLVELFPRHVSNLHIPKIERIPLDARVVLFSVGATLFAGIAAGLVPAIRGSRTNLAQAVKEGGRTTARGSRLRPILVSGQVGLALMLSAGAALVINSAVRRQRALGFSPDGVFTARVLLDSGRYPDETRRRQFVTELEQRLAAAPGVRAAGLVHFLPLCGWSSGSDFRTVDRPDDPRETGELVADASYFSTMRIPILRGRSFAPGDDSAAAKVMLVDERFARLAFPGRDPLGQRVNLGDAAKPDWREVIGVVGDVANDPPPSPQRPMIYVPFAQEDAPFIGIVARGDDSDATRLAGVVRDVVWSIDRDQPVSYVMTARTLVSDAFAVERTSTLILSFFAAVALLLAAMGIYGVLAHSVLERRHEIGIRVALGAPRRHIVRFMLGRLLPMTGAGLALGLAGALAGGRVLGALVEGVSPHDPLLLSIVVGLLALVAALAAWLPLRRAVRTDPMVALRED
jgi:putative ABC transport system permease protein